MSVDSSSGSVVAAFASFIWGATSEVVKRYYKIISTSLFKVNRVVLGERPVLFNPSYVLVSSIISIKSVLIYKPLVL